MARSRGVIYLDIASEASGLPIPLACIKIIVFSYDRYLTHHAPVSVQQSTTKGETNAVLNVPITKGKDTVTFSKRMTCPRKFTERPYFSGLIAVDRVRSSWAIAKRFESPHLVLALVILSYTI